MAKCNACGREDEHPIEVCVAMLRGQAEVLKDSLKRVLKARHNSFEDAAAREEAKNLLRE